MLVLRTLVFTVLAPGSVTVAVPILLVTSNLELASYEIGAVAWAGIAPMALGAACYLWCAGDFVFAGKGTPAPIDAPKALVSIGPYRVVRNPMYVSVGLVLVGEAVVLESLSLWVYSLLVFTAFHLFVVAYEEPNLRKRFGDAYEEYRRAVPRWFPRLSAATTEGHARR